MSFMNDLEHLYISPEQALLTATAPNADKNYTAKGEWWSDLTEEKKLIRARNEALEQRRQAQDAKQHALVHKIEQELSKTRPPRYSHVRSAIAKEYRRLNDEEIAAERFASLASATKSEKHKPVLAESIEKSYHKVAQARDQVLMALGHSRTTTSSPARPHSTTTSLAISPTSPTGSGPSSTLNTPSKLLKRTNTGMAVIAQTGIVTPGLEMVNPALPTAKAFSFITASPETIQLGDAIPPSQKTMRMQDALTIAAHATVANAAARRKQRQASPEHSQPQQLQQVDPAAAAGTAPSNSIETTASVTVPSVPSSPSASMPQSPQPLKQPHHVHFDAPLLQPTHLAGIADPATAFERLKAAKASHSSVISTIPHGMHSSLSMPIRKPLETVTMGDEVDTAEAASRRLNQYGGPNKRTIYSKISLDEPPPITTLLSPTELRRLKESQSLNPDLIDPKTQLPAPTAASSANVATSQRTLSSSASTPTLSRSPSKSVSSTPLAGTSRNTSLVHTTAASSSSSSATKQTASKSDVVPPPPVPSPDQPSTILWEFRDLGSPTEHHLRRTVYDNPVAIKAAKNHRQMVEEVLRKQAIFVAKHNSSSQMKHSAAMEQFRFHSKLLMYEDIGIVNFETLGVPSNMAAAAASSQLLPPPVLQQLLRADLSEQLDLNSREGRETLSELRYLQSQQIDLLGAEQSEFKSRMLRDFFIQEANERIAQEGEQQLGTIVRECAMRLRIHLRYLKHQYHVLEQEHSRQLSDHHQWIQLEAEARAKNRAQERQAKREARAAWKVKQFALHTGHHLLAAEAHSEELKSNRIAFQAMKTRFALYRDAHSQFEDPEMAAHASQQVPLNRLQRRALLASQQSSSVVFHTMKPREPLHDPTPLLNEFETHRPDRPPGHPLFVYLTSFRPVDHRLEKILNVPGINGNDHKKDENTSKIFHTNQRQQQFKIDLARDAAKSQALKADRLKEQAQKNAENLLELAADDPDAPTPFIPSKPDLSREDLTKERLAWVRNEESKKNRVFLREKKLKEKQRTDKLKFEKILQEEENAKKNRKKKDGDSQIEEEMTYLSRRLEAVVQEAKLLDAQLDPNATPEEREAHAMKMIDQDIRAKLTLQQEIEAGRVRINHKGEVVAVTPRQKNGQLAEVSKQDDDAVTAALKLIGASNAIKIATKETSKQQLMDEYDAAPHLLMRELEIVNRIVPAGTERERQIKARLQAELKAEVEELGKGDPFEFLQHLLPQSPLVETPTSRSSMRSPKGQSSRRGQSMSGRAGGVGSARNSMSLSVTGPSSTRVRAGSMSPGLISPGSGAMLSPDSTSGRRRASSSVSPGPSAGSHRGSRIESSKSPPSRLLGNTNKDLTQSMPNLALDATTPRSPQSASRPSSSLAYRSPLLKYSQSAMLATEVASPSPPTQHLEVLREAYSDDLAFEVQRASDAIAQIEEEEGSHSDSEDELSKLSIRPSSAAIPKQRKQSVMGGKPLQIITSPSSSPNASPTSPEPTSAGGGRGTSSPGGPKPLHRSSGSISQSGPTPAAATGGVRPRARAGSVMISSSKVQQFGLSVTVPGRPSKEPRRSVMIKSAMTNSSPGTPPTNTTPILAPSPTPPVKHPKASFEASWKPDLDARGLPIARLGSFLRPIVLTMQKPHLKSVGEPRLASPIPNVVLSKPWLSGLNIERDLDLEEEEATHMEQHQKELKEREEELNEENERVERQQQLGHSSSASSFMSSSKPLMMLRERGVSNATAAAGGVAAGGDSTSRLNSARPSSSHGTGMLSSRSSVSGLTSPSSSIGTRTSSAFAAVTGILQAKHKFLGGMKALKSKLSRVESRLMDSTATSQAKNITSPKHSIVSSHSRSGGGTNVPGSPALSQLSSRSLRDGTRSGDGALSGISTERSWLGDDSETNSGNTSMRSLHGISSPKNSSSSQLLSPSFMINEINPYYPDTELPLSNNVALTQSKWETSKFSDAKKSKLQSLVNEPEPVEVITTGGNSPTRTAKKRFNDTAITPSMALLHNVTADKTLDLHDPLHSPQLRQKRTVHATKVVHYSNLVPADEQPEEALEKAAEAAKVAESKNETLLALNPSISSKSLKKSSSNNKLSVVPTAIQPAPLTPRTLARRKLYTNRHTMKVNPLSDYAFRQWLSSHHKIFKSPILPQENNGRHTLLFKEITKADSVFKINSGAGKNSMDIPIDMGDVLERMFTRTGLSPLPIPQLRHLEKLFLTHFAGGQNLNEQELQKQRDVLTSGSKAASGLSGVITSHTGKINVTQFVQRFITSSMEEWDKWWTTQQELTAFTQHERPASPSSPKKRFNAKAVAESLPHEGAIIPLPLWVPTYHRLKILDRLMTVHERALEDPWIKPTPGSTGKPDPVGDLDLVDLWEATQAEVHARLKEFHDSSSKALETISVEEETKFANRLHRLFHGQLQSLMDDERQARLDQEEEKEESMLLETQTEMMKIALDAYHSTPAGKALLKEEARLKAQGLLPAQLPDPIQQVLSVATPRRANQLAPLPVSDHRNSVSPNSGSKIRASVARGLGPGRISVGAHMLEGSGMRREKPDIPKDQVEVQIQKSLWEEEEEKLNVTTLDGLLAASTASLKPPSGSTSNASSRRPSTASSRPPTNATTKSIDELARSAKMTDSPAMTARSPTVTPVTNKIISGIPPAILTPAIHEGNSFSKFDLFKITRPVEEEAKSFHRKTIRPNEADDEVESDEERDLPLFLPVTESPTTKPTTTTTPTAAPADLSLAPSAVATQIEPDPQSPSTIPPVTAEVSESKQPVEDVSTSAASPVHTTEGSIVDAAGMLKAPIESAPPAPEEKSKLAIELPPLQTGSPDSVASSPTSTIAASSPPPPIQFPAADAQPLPITSSPGPKPGPKPGHVRHSSAIPAALTTQGSTTLLARRRNSLILKGEDGHDILMNRHLHEMITGRPPSRSTALTIILPSNNKSISNSHSRQQSLAEAPLMTTAEPSPAYQPLISPSLMMSDLEIDPTIRWAKQPDIEWDF